ncbi:MAG: class I SAM-dependent methyltransferase [Deltaproteobacteria bacterium]|jgi:SAM-dependent methyltransferase|nr:class I SAM-dependent methyltransferase [Deltaproteobacteria bacterium]
MLDSTALDGIGRRHGTDKSGSPPGGHDYLRKYEHFLAHLRHEEFTLLELGIFRGASLKTWEEYFTKARIIGVDIEEETLRHAGGRVEVILGDLASTPFVESLKALNASVIIDDASHWWTDQLRALFVLYPSLPKGGVYIAEDIHTSFLPLAPLFSAGIDAPPARVLLKIAEYMTGNGKRTSIVPDKPLLPLSPEPLFHNEVRAMADLTDLAAFMDSSCILVRK